MLLIYCPEIRNGVAMEKTVELKNVDAFIIKDEFGSEYYGGSEAWFHEKKHREISNGTATLATILSYYHRSWEYFDSLCTRNPKKKDSFVDYMYDVLPYVKPGLLGIMPGDLRLGARKYAETRGFVFTSSEFAIPGPKMNRPQERAIIGYVYDGLSRDIPVGFINLGSAKVKDMKSNHWVIITALDINTYEMEVLDNGKILTIDFKKWLKKSKMGGAFAIIEPEFDDE